MSRELPSRPNLEYLRKQAKELLDAARHEHPEWQLADAQFALARGYGFASWPALKVHVESLAIDGAGRAPTPAGPSTTAKEDCPLAGSWRVNLEASRQHAAFPFQSASLEVRVAGPRVTMAQVVVDAEGKPSGGTITIDVDGQPRTLAEGGGKHQLVAHWNDARTLEVIDLLHGQEAGRGLYQVSPTGRTLTVTTAAQQLVFDRN